MGLINLEKKLCLSFEKVDIVGKRGRIVLIFLTNKVKMSVNVFLEMRDIVGVCLDNLYVFVRVNNLMDYIWGCDVIRECFFKCGVKYSELLRLIKLRKYIVILF